MVHQCTLECCYNSFNIVVCMVGEREVCYATVTVKELIKIHENDLTLHY